MVGVERIPIFDTPTKKKVKKITLFYNFKKFNKSKDHEI